MLQAFLWGIAIHKDTQKGSLQLYIIYLAETGDVQLSLAVLRQFMQSLLRKVFRLTDNFVYIKELCWHIKTFTFFIMKFLTNVQKIYFSQTPTHLKLLSLYFPCHKLSLCDSLPGSICRASALAKLLQAVIIIEP